MAVTATTGPVAVATPNARLWPGRQEDLQRYPGAVGCVDASHIRPFQCHEWGGRFLAMQAMKLLASSGVMAAAGAMISLTFAVSPPLTLLPPRPVPVDVNDNVIVISRQTVGAATTDTFGGRRATDGIPPMPIQPREGLDGPSGGLQMLPMPQDAPRVTPRRDPLEGLIGGLLLAQDAPQVTQVDQQEPAAAPQPEQQGSATSMVQEPPAQPSDVCARQGLRRIYSTQNNHRYWRCAGRR